MELGKYIVIDVCHVLEPKKTLISMGAVATSYKSLLQSEDIKVFNGSLLKKGNKARTVYKGTWCRWHFCAYIYI